MMQKEPVSIRVSSLHAEHSMEPPADQGNAMPTSDPIVAMHQMASEPRPRLRPPLSPARRAGAATVLAVFGLLIAAAFTVPALTVLRRTQQDNARTLAQLAHEQELSAAYDELRITMGRNAGAVARAVRALPVNQAKGETDVPELLALVAQMTESGTTGIFLDSVDVSGLLREEGDPEDLRYRTITLHGLAGTGSLERLLDSLRTALRLLDPAQLEFAYAGEGVVSFTLILHAYALAPNVK